MKKLLSILLLTTFFSGQVLAYYPDSDLNELNSMIDELELNSTHTKSQSKLKSTKVLSNKNILSSIDEEIEKVSLMSAHELDRHLKRKVRKAKRNAKKIRRILNKAKRNNRFLEKLSRKSKMTKEEVIYNLNKVVIKKIDKEQFYAELESQGGYLKSLESIKASVNSNRDQNNFKKASNKRLKSGDGIVLETIYLVTILGLFVAPFTLIAGIIVAILGGGIAMLLISAGLFGFSILSIGSFSPMG